MVARQGRIPKADGHRWAGAAGTGIRCRSATALFVAGFVPCSQMKPCTAIASPAASGDLAEHARPVRRILDDGGLGEVQIFASGGLDEQEIAALLADGAPIDGFGIGSKLDTSGDAPYLDCAYKLCEYAGAVAG